MTWSDYFQLWFMDAIADAVITIAVAAICGLISFFIVRSQKRTSDNALKTRISPKTPFGKRSERKPGISASQGPQNGFYDVSE